MNKHLLLIQPMRWSRTLTIAFLALCSAIALASSGYVQVSTFPAAAVADGHSQLNVTATVVDSRGNPLADGTQVDFETNIGTFRQNLITVQNGRAQAILVAGLIPGIASITVKVVGQDIAPVTATAEFVSSRSLLSNANQVAEFICPTGTQYDSQDQIVAADSDHHKVVLTYRDVVIRADQAQLDLKNMDVIATNAILKIGDSQQEFAQLKYNLDSLTGEGFANFTEKRVSVAPDGQFFTFRETPIEEFGHVAVHGMVVSRAKTPYIAKSFEYEDLTLAPAIVDSVKTVILPHRQVQFEKASLYVGDAHILSIPLYQLSLQQGVTTLPMDQIVSVNNNQIAVSYPYYLSLGPSQTSFLRFHMGDEGASGFGTGNGPQFDYEIDWNHGDHSQGGFLINGLGQSNWGIGAHQYLQMDSKTSISAQVQMPRFKSIFGSLNATHQMGVYSFNANSNISQTFTGLSLTDQSTNLSFQRDPMKIPGLPLRIFYGLTSNFQSTSAPVPIKSQSGYGLTTNFMMEPRRLDKGTTLNASLGLSELQGINVSKGIGANFSSLLSKRVNSSTSLSLGYNYTQDPFQASRFGSQRVTGTAFFQNGSGYAQFSTATSIGTQNINTSAEMGYRFAKTWRLDSLYSYDRILSTSFLDYGLTLFYRIGIREIGLTWTEQTHRLGLVVLGASFN